MDKEKLLTLTQAAARVNLSHRTISRAINACALSAFKSGGQLFINAKDLDDWAWKRANPVKSRCSPLFRNLLRTMGEGALAELSKNEPARGFKEAISVCVK